jgi:hypothetical protein
LAQANAQASYNRRSEEAAEGALIPFDNVPIASRPVRSKFQKDQSFGWLAGAGTTTSNPGGGGGWVKIGDHSEVGRRLFENVAFAGGNHRGQRRQEYGSK